MLPFDVADEGVPMPDDSVTAEELPGTDVERVVDNDVVDVLSVDEDWVGDCVLVAVLVVGELVVVVVVVGDEYVVVGFPVALQTSADVNFT